MPRRRDCLRTKPPSRCPQAAAARDRPFTGTGVTGLIAEGFDDGRADVPVGAAEPVERVVVVGAGIAGLTVANALAHGGADCVVVEARDRIGGRLHTVDRAGSPADLGGSWIHTPVGNPMRAFAQHVGVPCAARTRCLSWPVLTVARHVGCRPPRSRRASGAMTSGIREAKRLLGQPSVHLGLSPAMSIHLDERPVPMTRKAISTDAAPAALGPYSQAIVANGFVFCSGTAGIDPATGLPGDGIEAQTELALHNLEAILTATGASLSTLVKTTIFYANVEDFAAINAVYARFMSDPPPARSAPANVALPRGLLISIDAIAVLPSA